MKWEEGPCTLSSPSVGPQGSACPPSENNKQGPFQSCGSVLGGSRHRGCHCGEGGGEHLLVWAVTVLVALIVLTAAIQVIACWCLPPGSLPGLNQKWEEPEAVAFVLIQAPGPELDPSDLLGWKLQGWG